MYFGIPLPTSSEKLQSDTMDAIYVSVLLRMMDSSTKWLWRTGEIARYPLDKRKLTSVFYRAVSNADYPSLEKISESAIKEKQKFERLVVSKETLLEMFAVSLTLQLVSCFCSHDYSIINTKSISSSLRSLMEHLRLSTGVDLWWIFVLAHIYLIRVRSRHLWSPRYVFLLPSIQLMFMFPSHFIELRFLLPRRREQ